MTSSLMQALAELTLAASTAVVVVALLRRPLRRIAGIQVAYWLWLLVPISVLAVSLPPLPSKIRGSSALAGTLRGVVDIETVSAQLAHATVDYAALGVFLWIAGSVFVLAIVVHRQLALLRSLGNATAVANDLWRSASIGGPLVVGIFRPRIVVPADFESKYSPEERAVMLAHERAHLRRGDLLINGIATLWLCIFWFNPLMYWAIARLRLDQDLACDAAVLAESRMGRRRYADALLRTHLASEASSRAPVACCWLSGHPLKERIAMLGRPLPSFSRRLCGAAATAATILSGGCAVWSARPGTGDVQLANQSENSVIQADRAAVENGDTLLSGNVVIKFVSDAARVTTTGGDARFRRLDEGHYVIEGTDLRLSDGKFVITLPHGRIEKDGPTVVLTADSARVSQVTHTD
jgi:bla regulator protein BlaR1